MGTLRRLQEYLTTEFPGALIMPARECGKVPLYKHKGGVYTLEKCLREGIPACTHGSLILLPKELIVVDIDDRGLATEWEARSPAFAATVCCETSKGKHFYFRRTPACNTAGVFDGARQLKSECGGHEIPIDIKTCTKTQTCGVISIPPSRNKRWQRAPMQHEVLNMPDCFVDYFKRLKPQQSTKRKSTQQKTGSPAVDLLPAQHRAAAEPCMLDIEQARQLLRILNPARANNYGDWIQLGWCLHNISPTLLNEWIAFSSSSTKYVEGECEELWAGMRDSGLGIGSLHMWARLDAPHHYKELMATSVFPYIEKCNGSHHEVAQIAHMLLKGKYVCAVAHGRCWYRFNGSLWEEDVENLQLLRDLSTTVREHILQAMSRIASSVSIDDMQSTTGSHATSHADPTRQKCQNLVKLAFKLQDHGFKQCLLAEMRHFFSDKDFLNKLDANPSLLAFSNGVWDMASTPEDMVSLSVGYPYIPEVDHKLRNQVIKYFETLHPDPDQRMYVLRMLSRQLYGDNGSELFHIHAGLNGSAGNGKTKFFTALEYALGSYIQKFKIELLVCKQRGEANRPDPEVATWRGRRILFSTEPNPEDKLHSGILKEKSGGEKVVYRLLFSNQMQEYHPQFKLHLMCNVPPQVDGGDTGVQRRMRILAYQSRFVPASEAKPEEHMYTADPTFIEAFKDDTTIRMEFLRYLLDHYDHGYDYQMPEAVKVNSSRYLNANDAVRQFAEAHIVAAPDGFFTLKEAWGLFVQSGLATNNDKRSVFCQELQRVLHKQCIEQCAPKGHPRLRSVFMGYELVSDS